MINPFLVVGFCIADFRVSRILNDDVGNTNLPRERL